MSFRTTFMTDKSGKGGREREKIIEYSWLKLNFKLLHEFCVDNDNAVGVISRIQPDPKQNSQSEREREKTHINADCVQWDRETIEIIFAALNFVIE